MNQTFATAIAAIPGLFTQLDRCEAFVEKGRVWQKDKSGVYAFVEDGVVVHVGRTRNLMQRLRGHISNSHFSASFAFKRCRLELDRRATYVTQGSRSDLLKDPVFGPNFLRHVQLVRSMQVKFVQVEDPVIQYLLELYAHCEYGLSLDEFDTH